MTVRGVEFAGAMFDDFSPVLPVEHPDLSMFPGLYHFAGTGMDLCACTIELNMFLPAVTPAGQVQAKLHVKVELGSPTERGGIDLERVHLTLHLEDQVYPGTGTSGWFEDEFRAINRALPEGHYLKACINCAYSDYSVYGAGVFGSMICYRCCKDEYLQVRDKHEYMNVVERFSDQTFFVQETYLCSEFERRVPGTGYRG